jgi:hypothetical protein
LLEERVLLLNQPLYRANTLPRPRMLLIGLLLLLQHQNVIASYCGSAAIPFSFEALPDGQPVSLLITLMTLFFCRSSDVLDLPVLDGTMMGNLLEIPQRSIEFIRSRMDISVKVLMRLPDTFLHKMLNSSSLKLRLVFFLLCRFSQKLEKMLGNSILTRDAFWAGSSVRSPAHPFLQHVFLPSSSKTKRTSRLR